MDNRLLTRRTLLLGCGVAVLASAGPLWSAERIARVGVIGEGSARNPPDEFAKTLRELGWSDGKNLQLDYRFSGNSADKLPALAAELVSLRPDAILAVGTRAALAAKRATPSVPIILYTSGDPIRNGLVSNLAKPGGNITGNASLAGELALKRIELIRELLPHGRRFAYFVDRKATWSAAWEGEMEADAQTMGMHAASIQVPASDELERTFSTIQRLRADALLVDEELVAGGDLVGRRVAELATSHRIPTIGDWAGFALRGGFASYSPDESGTHRQAAQFLDKILRGAKPSELPLIQPSRFELVINLRTAKQLDVVVPQSILLRADQIIQ